MSIRSPNERKAAALHRLEHDANVWIATANASGTPHLIPLSLAWDGARIIVATPTASPTVRNAGLSGSVKASMDSAADVVLIDGTADIVDRASAGSDLLRLHSERVGWQIPADGDAWSILIITPRVIRVWNSPAEIPNRTIMRHGVWIP